VSMTSTNAGSPILIKLGKEKDKGIVYHSRVLPTEEVDSSTCHTILPIQTHVHGHRRLGGG
jgi:hypothetical protein